MAARWALLILLSSVLSPAAGAAPTVFCFAEQWATDLAARELAQGELIFTTGSKAVAAGAVGFKLGDLRLHISIEEILKGQGVVWKPQLKVYNGKTNELLAESDSDTVNVSLDDNDMALLHCDIFEKTEPFRIPPLSSRERLRLKRLGGLGAVREYARKKPSVYDIYDLFQLLTRIESPEGDFLRKTYRAILEAGGVNVFLSDRWDNGDETRGRFATERKNAICGDSKTVTYRCDIESFDIVNGFWIPSDKDNDFHSIEVQGRLRRDVATRLIREFEITSVAVTLPREDRGSGSDSGSSGGRLSDSN